MTTVIFKCDVCGSVHDSLEKAIACEQKLLPVPRFSIGDTVYIDAMYDGIVKDIIVDVVIEDHDIVYITTASYGYDDRRWTGKYADMYISEQLLIDSASWDDYGVMMTKDKPEGYGIKEAIAGGRYDTFT